MKKKPIVLCILDGWGEDPTSLSNAIEQAHTPTWDRLKQTWPHRLIDASGPAVGLPEGQMGNSEVGHLTLGAGQVLLQDLPRLTQAIRDGSFKSNPILLDLIEKLKTTKGTCHLLGLLSDGGVHSHIDQQKAFIDYLAQHHIPVALHAFLDGRDTPPMSAARYLEDLINFCNKRPQVQIVSLSGRYYAMDRDQNWERVQLAYEAIVAGKGPTYQDPQACLKAYYAESITDEFIPPTVLEGYKGVNAADAFFVANFRADRVRQLLKSLTFPSFDAFTRAKLATSCCFYGLTHYADWLTPYIKTLFSPEGPAKTLGQVLAEANLTQYRIAETEKYAHVTYFFNGGNETPVNGEERCLVPSPKVATYDLMPEMAALQVTETLCEAIHSQQYDFLLVNYANTDMVGHTGNMAAAIKAVETIDGCLEKLEKAVLAAAGTLLITADHGNIEQLVDPKTLKPHTAHTCSQVPFVMVGTSSPLTQAPAGLADVAPTILTLLGLAVPTQFSGRSLIEVATP